MNIARSSLDTNTLINGMKTMYNNKHVFEV